MLFLYSFECETQVAINPSTVVASLLFPFNTSLPPHFIKSYKIKLNQMKSNKTNIYLVLSHKVFIYISICLLRYSIHSKTKQNTDIFIP